MPCYSYQKDTDKRDEDPEAPGTASERPEGEAPSGDPMPPAPLSLPPERPQAPYSSASILGPDGTPIGLPPAMPPEQEFKSIRRFITASQIIALVSLIIGGVPLSTVAVVLGLIARSKAGNRALDPNDPNRGAWMLLRRSATVAAIMGAVALVLNAITLAMVYPVMVEMLQSGDLGSLMGGGAAAGGSVGGSNSVWG